MMISAGVTDAKINFNWKMVRLFSNRAHQVKLLSKFRWF